MTGEYRTAFRSVYAFAAFSVPLGTPYVLQFLGHSCHSIIIYLVRNVMKLTDYLHWLGWQSRLVAYMHQCEGIEVIYRRCTTNPIVFCNNRGGVPRIMHKHRSKSERKTTRNGKTGTNLWATEQCAQWITLIMMLPIIALSTLWLPTSSRKRERELWNYDRDRLSYFNYVNIVSDYSRNFDAKSSAWRFSVHTFCQWMLSLSVLLLLGR